MLRRVAASVIVMCFIVTTGLFAQESTTMTGQYSTIRLTTDTVTTQNGGALVYFTYGLVTVTDDPTDLFNNGKGDCAGTSVLTEDGTPVAMSGWCFVTDMDGDGWWQWWKMEEFATPDCPLMCGTWGNYNGVGKFENVSVNGTFRGTASFPDGSGSGVSEATYERR